MSSIKRTILSLAFLAVVGVGHALAESASINTPADQIKFFPTGLKTDKGEPLAGPAYGDMQKGAHGTFIKMPQGYQSAAHSHANDYYAVVVNGTVANHPPGAAATPLSAGSYWFQQAGENHVTECLSSDGCLFFVVQAANFDFIPAK